MMTKAEKQKMEQLAADVKHLEKSIVEERNLTKLAHKEFYKLKAEMDAMTAVHGTIVRSIDRMENVPKEDRARVRLEVDEAFGALAEQSPVWLALQKLLALQIHVEHVAARGRGLTNDERNMNLGRESGLEDFRAALLQIFARTRKK